MTGWETYLIFQATSFKVVFRIIFLLSAVFTIFTTMILRSNELDPSSDDAECIRRTRIANRIGYCLTFIFLLATFLTPSTRTMLLMYAVPVVATKERIDSVLDILDHAIDVADKQLDMEKGK